MIYIDRRDEDYVNDFVSMWWHNNNHTKEEQKIAQQQDDQDEIEALKRCGVL